jgi:hypothetical protein
MPRPRNQDDKIVQFFQDAELAQATTLFNVVKGVMGRRAVPVVKKAPAKKRGPNRIKAVTPEFDPGKEN